jgi:hypothetical protein
MALRFCKNLQCKNTLDFRNFSIALFKDGSIRPVVGASALTWFIAYIFINTVPNHIIIIKTKVLLPQE